MKFLAPSPQIIQQTTGFASISDAQQDNNPFCSFMPDDISPLHLYHVHDAPYAMIIESFAQSSQFGRMADSVSPLPVISIALDGRGFHGQHHRTWLTSPGNLYLCARFPIHSTRFPHYLQMIPPIAAARLDHHIQIKWPNDIVVQIDNISYAKIGGCLTSYKTTPSAVTFGIGLNIQSAPIITNSFDLPAASMLSSHFDIAPDFPRILNHIINHLNTLIHDFINNHHILLDEYRNHIIGIGQHVSLYQQTPDNLIYSGILKGITDDLGLIVDDHIFYDVRMRLF